MEKAFLLKMEDDDMLKQIKIAAAKSELTMRKYVIKAIKSQLKKQVKEDKTEEIERA